MTLTTACTGPDGGEAPESPMAGGGDPTDVSGSLPSPRPVSAAPGIPGVNPALEGTHFVDVARPWGVDHVRSRIGPDVVDLVAAGVCVVDVDGEPPLDLFFARRAADGGSILYVGEGVGDYRDATVARGLSDTGDALGCLALDADGDGDQDLLTVGLETLKLFDNRDGAFVDASARLVADQPPFPMYTGAAAGDVDGDGDLDLVVAGYLSWDPERHPPGSRCGLLPCELNAGWHRDIPNLLLLQQGDGTFVDLETRLEAWRARDPDVLEACPHPTDPEGHPDGLPGCPLGLDSFYEPAPTFAVGVVDADRDGLPDIFLGNDFGFLDQLVSRRYAERYAELGTASGLARNAQGLGMDTMGWASGDLDGDGILDHVRTGAEGENTAVHVSRGQRRLYEDESLTIGTADRRGSFRWGPALVDHDLDGDLDLFEATGHVYLEQYLPDLGFRGELAQPTNLYENDGSGRLEAFDPTAGDPLGRPTEGRGIAVADLDDDGRPEVILANAIGPPQILRSVGRTDGHWLRVRLVGAGANREAALARVLVGRPPGGPVQLRVKKLGEGFGGNGDPRLLFGLLGDDSVDIQVTWADGTQTELYDQPVDQQVTIVQ